MRGCVTTALVTMSRPARSPDGASGRRCRPTTRPAVPTTSRPATSGSPRAPAAPQPPPAAVCARCCPTIPAPVSGCSSHPTARSTDRGWTEPLTPPGAVACAPVTTYPMPVLADEELATAAARLEDAEVALLSGSVVDPAG